VSTVELAIVPVLVAAAGAGGFAAARMRQTSPSGRHPAFTVSYPRSGTGEPESRRHPEPRQERRLGRPDGVRAHDRVRPAGHRPDRRGRDLVADPAEEGQEASARMVTVIAAGSAGFCAAVLAALAAVIAAGSAGLYAAVLAALAAVFLIRRRTGRRA